MSRQPFLEMPVHLLSMVLSDLDGMQTLGSAILSHPSFYAAYKERSTNIITRIVQNQIPLDLMPYAISVYEATRVDYRNPDDVMNLLLRFFSDVALPPSLMLLPRHLEPAAAHLISKTHSAVEQFSSDFVDDILPLAQDQLGLGRPNYDQASADEIFRIRRAFYRFQLYCNLTFRDQSDLRRSKRQRANLHSYLQIYFFGYFSPWVNEQLACIHDYLERVLSIAFDEIAAHDVEWGAKSVNWVLQGKQNEYKQAYLSYGLHFLSKLMHRAKSYDERLKILKAKGLPQTKAMLAAHFRKAVVNDDPIYYPQYFSELRRWTIDQLPLLEKPQTDGPCDTIWSGSFWIWFAAHKDCYLHSVVFQPKNSHLRRCGYVMWDAPEKPIEGGLSARLREAHRQALIDLIELARAGDQMRRSWGERAEIYKQGGRGYWSEGDLSRIVWNEAASER